MMIRRLFESKVLLILALSNVFIDKVASDADVCITASNYPQARRDENVSDTYPGNTIVKDPYRWLEKLDCDETKKFVEAETALARSYLDKCPFRTELAARYKELYPFKSFDAFFQAGNKYFSLQTDGSLSNDQDAIFVQDSPSGEAKLLLDPNKLSKDNSITLDYTFSTVSDDGMIFGYLLGACDSSWSTIKFLHVEKGDIYKETLTRVQNSYITYNVDHKGIFYSGYLDHKGKLDATDNGPLKNQKLYYHVLGTDQSQDIVVAEFPDKPDSILNGWVIGHEKNQYLVVAVIPDSGNTNCVYIADLGKINFEIKGKLDFIPVVTKDDDRYLVVALYDTTFVFITNKDAPNQKLISFDITDVGKTWKDLVPEDKKNKLEFAAGAYDKYLVLCYTEDSKSVLQLHDIKTGQLIKKFDLEIGTIDGSTFFSDLRYKDFYFTLQSYTTPATIYHCDLSKPSYDLEIFQETKLKNLDRQKLTTEQVFFKSKDGTQISMMLVHKKDLQKDGNNPILMINNGGYGGTMPPTFSTNWMLFVYNMNGIYAVVSNRGGGEYGEQWHQAGSLHNKQNAIDDTNAAVEYLIAQKYTNAKLIGVRGAGFGAALMGACINQRPDLYRALYTTQGMFDMLRFDKYPGGEDWIPEIGSPTNATDFPFIFKYSPLHNIKLGDSADTQYPTIWLDCAFRDDIPQAHSLKFMATLQFEAKNHPTQKNPFILAYDPTTFDQSSKLTVQDEYEELTAWYVDMYSFFAMNLGAKFQSSCL